jgi:hypothetical protein
MGEIECMPIIIMGAPRSGTNALRDALTALPDFGTWPCDEINGIWRYRSLNVGYDNLVKRDASGSKIKYIREKFSREFERLGKPKFLVEKTCANTMRPSFVAEVVPEATYIYIIRDGSEVVESAKKRWRGEFEFNLIRYWLDKIRYIPVLDFPHYFYDIVLRRFLSKIFGKKDLASWGPTHPTLDKWQHECSLEDLVALQWSLCVISSWWYFRKIGSKKCVFVTYDGLLINPDGFLSRFQGALGSNVSLPLDVRVFSERFFSPKNTNNEFVPSHSVVKKYYSFAMKIYHNISLATA